MAGETKIKKAPGAPVARPPVTLDRKTIQMHLHMPLSEAAVELGVCATTLKKVCRKLGFQRWPYKRNRPDTETLRKQIGSMDTPSPEADVASPESPGNPIIQIRKVPAKQERISKPPSPYNPSGSPNPPQVAPQHSGIKQEGTPQPVSLLDQQSLLISQAISALNAQTNGIHKIPTVTPAQSLVSQAQTLVSQALSSSAPHLLTSSPPHLLSTPATQQLIHPSTPPLLNPSTPPLLHASAPAPFATQLQLPVTSVTPGVSLAFPLNTVHGLNGLGVGVAEALRASGSQELAALNPAFSNPLGALAFGVTNGNGFTLQESTSQSPSSKSSSCTPAQTRPEDSLSMSQTSCANSVGGCDPQPFRTNGGCGDRSPGGCGFSACGTSIMAGCGPLSSGVCGPMADGCGVLASGCKPSGSGGCGKPKGPQFSIPEPDETEVCNPTRECTSLEECDVNENCRIIEVNNLIDPH